MRLIDSCISFYQNGKPVMGLLHLPKVRHLLYRSVPGFDLQNHMSYHWIYFKTFTEGHHQMPRTKWWLCPYTHTWRPGVRLTPHHGRSVHSWS
jgi:hypothetical protein